MKTFVNPPSELPPPPPLSRVNGVPDGAVAVRMPNWLGDFCMALPAVGQLAQYFKRVILIVPVGLEPLARELDETPAPQVIALSAPHQPWSREEVENLRSAHADCALLLNNSFRDAWYIFRAGIPLRYGASRRCRGWLLTKAFRLPKVKKGVLNCVHQFRKYSAMAEALTGVAWNEGREIKLRGDYSQKSGKTTLFLAPGAAYGAAKRWPSERFGELARLFLEAHPDGEVTISGGRGEEKIVEEIVRTLDPARVRNLCGKTDVLQLCRELGRAHVCVANDSGVMHLAAQLGLPGVAIFGATDCSSTSPISEKWRVVYSDFPCAPCFERVCPKYPTPACMEAISSEFVFKQVEECLNGD